MGSVAKMAYDEVSSAIFVLSSILEPYWGHLGPSWGPLGPILGPSWAHLGPSWGPLGAILEPSWALSGSLGPCWADLALILSSVGATLARLPIPRPCHRYAQASAFDPELSKQASSPLSCRFVLYPGLAECAKRLNNYKHGHVPFHIQT